MTPESMRSIVHEALDPMVRPAPGLPGQVIARVRAEQRERRPPRLRRAVRSAGVLAAAAVVAVVGIATHQGARPRLVAPGPVTPSFSAPAVPLGPGATLAWLDTGAGYDRTGRLVGHVGAAATFRSADGNEVYALVDHGVEAYGATTGKLERTIARQGAGQAAGLSPDGRYLAVFGGNPAAVELIDLTAGRSVGRAQVGPSFPAANPGYVLVGPNAARLVVFSGYWQHTSVATLHFDGTMLAFERQATDGQPGHRVSSCNGMTPQNDVNATPIRLTPDGLAAVAACPGDGLVTWLDLNRLTITAQVKVQENNPFWLSPVFAHDGSMLYVHEAGTGRITVIDVMRRAIVRTALVNAPTASNPFGWLGDRLFPPAYAGAIPRSAAVSPDGAYLYVTGAFGRPVGIAAVRLRDFQVVAQWKVDAGNDLWLSGDGRTIFAIAGNNDHLSILHLEDGSVATVTLPSQVGGFLTLPA